MISQITNPTRPPPADSVRSRHLIDSSILLTALPKDKIETVKRWNRADFISER
jgi:hypothetical protein